MFCNNKNILENDISFGHVDASDSELLKKLQRIRRQMLETAMVIDREEGEPCPKVIAPFHIGGDASWGRRYIGGAFLNGFTPKRGPFAIGVKRRVTVIQRGPNEPCPVIVEDDRQFNIDAGLGPTGFAHFRGHGESERLGRGYKKWNLGLGVNRATVKSKGINIGIPLQARIVDLRSANCSRSTVTIIRQKVGHPEPIVVEDDRWASFDFNIGPRLDMDFYGGGNALMGSSPLTIHKPYFWGGAIDGRIGWAKRSSLTVIKLTDKESLPDIVVENRRAALEFNYGHKMGAESFGYGSVVKIHENQFSPHVLNQWSGSLEGSVGWGHGINFGAYLKPTIIRLGYDESEPDLDDCCVQDESFPIGISS
ncbi:hypothetical protein T01_10176 [Trichinella spiralis]|nr:hypothetical protein T01_10176 [Trichinella spiralis]